MSPQSKSGGGGGIQTGGYDGSQFPAGGEVGCGAGGGVGCGAGSMGTTGTTGARGGTVGSAPATSAQPRPAPSLSAS